MRIYHLIWLIFAGIMQGYALEVDMNVYSYLADKTYAEVHLRVQESSVQAYEENGVFKVGVEFMVIVFNQQGAVTYGDKFILNGLRGENPKDYVAIKRFFVLPGIYKVHVTAKDLYAENNSQEFERMVSVFEDWDGRHGLSDPLFTAQLTPVADDMDAANSRHGYYFEPLPYSYADTIHDSVVLFQEIYLPVRDSVETYYLNYTISDQYKNNLESKVLISQYKKLDSKGFQFVAIPVSLKELASGEYHLSTYLVTRDKKKYASRKMNFYKSNPAADLALLEISANENMKPFLTGLDASELDYILKAHVPITPNSQLPTLQQLIKSESTAAKKKFIEQYWQKRSAENPSEAYEKYMEVARAVDKEFYSNVGYGFQTHRGYIFLKHGKPSNVLTIENEPDAPPYEIWYYNKIQTTNQTNVRFLFWNESLSHNDFWLLHSTCYGERNNPSWETQLYKAAPEDKIGNTVDATEVKKGINRLAKVYFHQF